MIDPPPEDFDWLRDGWAPTIHDASGLARLHEVLAARPAPAASPWREVGRVAVALADQPALAVEARLKMHRDTVMDLDVGPSGDAASVDFSGRWSVWCPTSLRPRARGDFGREARAIRLADDGARIAALVNLGPSALYNYDAFIAAVDGDAVVHCHGRSVERLCWEGEFLVLGSVLGYRVQHESGAPICVDEAPRGLSATCFVGVPRHGHLRCIRRDVLGGVEIGTRDALPCVDVAGLSRGNGHWRHTSLDVRGAGDLVALAPRRHEVFVLELGSGRTIVELELQGPPIVDMKVAFDASGRYLLLSATHIRGQVVTHLVYDGSRGAVVGALTTTERMFGHHARVVIASAAERVLAADGDTIVVARVPG